MRLNSNNRLESFDRPPEAESNTAATVATMRNAQCRVAGPQVRPPAPIMFSVALQPDETISGMNRAELIDLIRLADLPPMYEGAYQRLDYLNRPDLKRLAFLTRRCCRNHINSYIQCLGKSAPFIADV